MTTSKHHNKPVDLIKKAYKRSGTESSLTLVVLPCKTYRYRSFAPLALASWSPGPEAKPLHHISHISFACRPTNRANRCLFTSDIVYVPLYGWRLCWPVSSRSRPTKSACCRCPSSVFLQRYVVSTHFTFLGTTHFDKRSRPIPSAVSASLRSKPSCRTAGYLCTNARYSYNLTWTPRSLSLQSTSTHLSLDCRGFWGSPFLQARPGALLLLP